MDDQSFNNANMIGNRIESLRRRIGMFRKVDRLPIISSGIDEEGDPFVLLKNKTILYGSPVTRKRDKVLYRLLSKETKRVLRPECVQVALDVMIRYFEAGLKYGGPKKESRYKVKSGDKVAEMGAYQGFCSVKLAQKVGASGHVVAIEPMPDNFRLLKKNKAANQLDQMHIVNCGVWDKQKTLIFNRMEGDHQSSSIEMKYKNGERISVEADTLDKIFEGVGEIPEDFMIIQLNGAEINGLRGLTTFKPKNLTIAARYDTEGDDAALVIHKELLGRGYQAEIVDEDYIFASIEIR